MEHLVGRRCKQLAALSFLLRRLRYVQTVWEGGEQRKTFLMKELTGCAADILICQRWEQVIAAALGPVHNIRTVTVNKPAQQVGSPRSGTLRSLKRQQVCYRVTSKCPQRNQSSDCSSSRAPSKDHLSDKNELKLEQQPTRLCFRQNLQQVLRVNKYFKFAGYLIMIQE